MKASKTDNLNNMEHKNLDSLQDMDLSTPKKQITMGGEHYINIEQHEKALTTLAHKLLTEQIEVVESKKWHGFHGVLNETEIHNQALDTIKAKLQARIKELDL